LAFRLFVYFSGMSYLDERRKFIEDGRPLPQKKKYGLNKVSKKRAAKIAEQRLSGTDSEMDLFFKANRPKMKGRCLFCNGDTMKKDDKKFHFSLAHLLPKSVFRSVATHPDILIELCFFGESCHSNFDSGKITWEFIKDSKEWDIIKEKLLNVLPAVAIEERKNKLYSKLQQLVYEK
jgi:hypothetical protein